MYYGVNQCFIQPEYRGNGTVQVVLSHNMPRFDCYEVRINGNGGWQKYYGDFLWELTPGKNSIEVRAVNQYGIPGSSSSLSITKRA